VDLPVQKTDFPGLTLLKRGKVRDIYDLGDTLIIVATDRISAFDVIMPDPVPEKGCILTRISEFWFDMMASMIPNHLLTTKIDEYPVSCRPYADILEGRSMLVRKARPLPVECVVRGYIAGSGWKEYLETGSVCGIPLPEGLVEADRLPTPIFTPSTKSEVGDHDINISYEELKGMVGEELSQRLKEISLAIYQKGMEYADLKGIIIADTKFEFGIVNDELILIDEVLTPDSSRFWPKESYRPGGPQNSFDKQYLRDYLVSIGWDMRPPAPELPKEVIENTRKKYLEALKRLTGDDSAL